MRYFLNKFTSRKFLVALVGIVVGLATAFGITENEYAQIVGLIGSIASGMTYIVSEAQIDKEGTKTPVVLTDKEGSEDSE